MNIHEQMALCCFQQAKTIHRLLLALADDLGDLSINKGANAETYGKLADLVSGALECTTQEVRDELEKLTR